MRLYCSINQNSQKKQQLLNVKQFFLGPYTTWTLTVTRYAVFILFYGRAFILIELYSLAEGLVHEIGVVDFHDALVFLKQAVLSGAALFLHSTDIQTKSPDGEHARTEREIKGRFPCTGSQTHRTSCMQTDESPYGLLYHSYGHFISKLRCGFLL